MLRTDAWTNSPEANITLPYADILGISLHPVMSSHRADKIPPDMFEKVFALTKKPIAITESSYSSQAWALTVNGTKFNSLGSTDKQNTFTSLLLKAANSYNCPFVVIFAIRDYDELWVKLEKPDAALPIFDTLAFLYSLNSRCKNILSGLTNYIQKRKISVGVDIQFHVIADRILWHR